LTRMADSRPLTQPIHVSELASMVMSDPAPRIDFIGVVVAADNNKPSSFVVDDGTGLALVRRFDDKDAPMVGVTIRVIGRLRDSGERYIACEIACAIDPAWVEVRKLELQKRAPQAAKQDAQVDDSDLLVLVRTLDTGEGALIDDIIAKIPDAEKALRLMMSRGDIYELSPGRIKILE
jgi:hypothetical protein